jgi:hypothetical protein
MSNQNINTMGALDLKSFDFQAQFRRCEQWNNPEQWDALGLLYYQRGYLLNALHCFERAEACRLSKAPQGEALIANDRRAVAVETE